MRMVLKLVNEIYLEVKGLSAGRNLKTEMMPVRKDRNSRSRVAVGAHLKQSPANSFGRRTRYWVIVQQIINRNAVVVNVARDESTRMAATALRLDIVCGRWRRGKQNNKHDQKLRVGARVSPTPG